MKNALNLKQIPKHTILSGVPNYANDFILANIIKQNNDSNYLYITANDLALKNSKVTLSKILKDYEIVEFPAWDCQPYDRVSPNAQISVLRMNALYKMLSFQNRRLFFFDI